MRTKLLIILLLPLMAVGQDSIKPKFNVSYANHGPLPGFDGSNGTAKDIVKLWDNYKKDCFNDSTYQRVHNPQKYGERWCVVYPESPNICREDSHYGKEWIHKETSFEGFIDWLTKISKR